MSAFFTIGVPVTKIRHLAKTLSSLTAQSRGDWELVIVDNQADGPIEPMLSECFAGRARLIKRAHRLPPVENWNSLLSEVRTPWFILLSDDDYLEPSHLQQLFDLLGRFPKVDVVHTRVRLVDEHDQPLGITPLAPEWETVTDLIWHRCSGLRQQFLSDFLWRTSALREQGGFAQLPSAWGTDDLTAVRLAARGGIAFGRVATLNYRIHTGSITGKVSPFPKIEAVHRLVEEYTSILTSLSESEDSEAKEVASWALAKLETYRATACRDLLAAGSFRFILKALFLHRFRLSLKLCVAAAFRKLRSL